MNKKITKNSIFDSNAFGARLKAYRLKRGFSMRGLASRAGVTASFISMVESGKTSPTIITLQKILEALKVPVAEFFSDESTGTFSENIVFKHKDMKLLEDNNLRWLFAYPPDPDIKMVISYEEYLPKTRISEFEWHNNDMGGYVLSGELTIDIPERGVFKVSKGDAFYIKAETKHVANNKKNEVLKMVTALLK